MSEYKMLKKEDEEYKTARWLIAAIWRELFKVHPKLKSVDSNFFHFVVYDVLQEHPELKLTNGWYYWGPYIPAVDDVLVEEGMLEAQKHQMNPDCKHEFSEMVCECHPKKDG